SFLPRLAEILSQKGVGLHGSGEAAQLIFTGMSEGAPTVTVMGDEDYHKEYLEKEISIKVVEGVEEAVSHINRFGSHHTDAIITADDAAWDYFSKMVDSAGVYRNVSTRFADGFRYGFGAEVGVSTSKLHARGPVGLEGLMTYKYRLTGHGQIVGDYAGGSKEFHFKDLL
ncbi:MAG: gamma-glutamyl-phosphate reductase, partial [Lachnospiraceae bacterium]|nr:gamma-glutamyl-phosphate reductase [Lachnospiraceae bacterium]